MIKTYKFIFYLKQRFTGNNNKQDNFKRKMPPWQSLSLDLGKLKAHSKVCSVRRRRAWSGAESGVSTESGAESGGESQRSGM
jgi:hypothetical protein